MGWPFIGCVCDGWRSAGPGGAAGIGGGAESKVVGGRKSGGDGAIVVKTPAFRSSLAASGTWRVASPRRLADPTLVVRSCACRAPSAFWPADPKLSVRSCACRAPPAFRLADPELAVRSYACRAPSAVRLADPELAVRSYVWRTLSAARGADPELAVRSYVCRALRPADAMLAVRSYSFRLPADADPALAVRSMWLLRPPSSAGGGFSEKRGCEGGCGGAGSRSVRSLGGPGGGRYARGAACGGCMDSYEAPRRDESSVPMSESKVERPTRTGRSLRSTCWGPRLVSHFGQGGARTGAAHVSCEAGRNEDNLDEGGVNERSCGLCCG